MSDPVRSHRRQPTRLPRPWDSQGKNTGMGCHFLLQYVKVKLLSRVRLLRIPGSDRAPLSLEFSKQECWSGLSFPTSEDLPDPGIEPGSPALQANFLPSEPVGKPFLEARKSKTKALADLVSGEGPPPG